MRRIIRQFLRGVGREARRQPTVVDIFCGPGGLSEGFKRAGFQIVTAVDSDKTALQTYERNHPEVPTMNEDVGSVHGDDILDKAASWGRHGIDVVVAGPPCRGLSMANARTRGHGNPCNKLFQEFVRVVKEIRPKMCVMENVRSLYHLSNSEVKNQITSQLEGDGYRTFCKVLNAADFGVPQIRRRTFIVGTRVGEFCFPEPTHGIGLPRYASMAEALSDLPPIAEGGRGESPCSYTCKPKTSYQEQMRNGSALLLNHVTTKNTDEVVQRFRVLPQGGNWRNIEQLLKLNGKYRQIKNTHTNIYRRLRWHEPANTMVNPRKSMCIHPEQHRLLSVREVARLQSFPDIYVFEGKLHSMQQQVADAVPVFMARAVAEKVLECLAGNSLL